MELTKETRKKQIRKRKILFLFPILGTRFLKLRRWLLGLIIHSPTISLTINPKNKKPVVVRSWVQPKKRNN